MSLLLNVTPDHLDRHGSMGEYAAAKMKIFAGQGEKDTAIVNGDDHYCRELADGLGGAQRLLFFGGVEGCHAHVDGHAVVLEWQGKREQYDLTGTMLDSATGALNCAAAILAVRTMGCSPAIIGQDWPPFKWQRTAWPWSGRRAGLPIMMTQGHQYRGSDQWTC